MKYIIPGAVGNGVPIQTVYACWTHWASHDIAQQNGSTAHILSSHPYKSVSQPGIPISKQLQHIPPPIGVVPIVVVDGLGNIPFALYINNINTKHIRAMLLYMFFLPKLLPKVQETKRTFILYKIAIIMMK